MTWESVIGGALQGISNFVTTLVSVIGGSLNSAAIEGIIALTAVGFIIRLVDVGPKIPGKIAERVKKKKDDDDEWEYIRVRRRE